MENSDPPSEAFLQEQFHRHQQVQENMRLKPEPKRDDGFRSEISARAGEIPVDVEPEKKPREVNKRENREEDQPMVEPVAELEESEEPVILEEAPVVKRKQIIQHFLKI